MNIRKSWKGVPIVVLICILISSILAVYAYTTWTRTIEWNIANINFEVYDATGTTQLYDLEIESITSSSYTVSYKIRNVGDVAILVSLSSETWVSSGDASWVGLPATIGIGSEVTVTLSLSNLAVGTGSYQFTFNSAAA